MNVLSRDRTDHFIHLFVERRADLARALTTAAKVAATQAFRASLAELTHEVLETKGPPSYEGWKETFRAVGLTVEELVLHTDSAIRILEAINRGRNGSPGLFAGLRNRLAQ